MIARIKGHTQDSQNQRAYIGQPESKGIHRIARIKGLTQDSQNQRAYTGQSESKSIHRIVRIKGLTQDNQNQRAFIGQSESVMVIYVWERFILGFVDNIIQELENLQFSVYYLVERCLFFFFWSIHYLSLDLRLLINSLVSQIYGF